MPWWATFWILALIIYAIATVWNDGYEGRRGLVTWMAVLNVILNIFFFIIWAYSTLAVSQAAMPLLPALAGLSLVLTLWHGTAGYRQIKTKNPEDYLPLEHQTLVQINALSLPFEMLIFGLPTGLALLFSLS